MLQTVSVLLDESNVPPAPAGGTSFAGNEGALELLGSLGHAVAIGVEAGEEVDEVSAGAVKLRVRWRQQSASKASCTKLMSMTNALVFSEMHPKSKTE